MTENNSKKRLIGKVAVVTGAGRGIGRAEAMLLARQGANVVVNDLGCDMHGIGDDRSIAQRVVDEIIKEGGNAVANSDSVTTIEGARKIIATALTSYGRLDILINNAGIARPGAIDEIPDNEWDSVIEVNLRGSFATIRNAAPIFREQRCGVIVNTSSESGLGHYHMASYSAAKEGIIGLTRTVARDLGQYNVRCNAIRPTAPTRMITPELLETVQISQEILGIPALGNRWVSPDLTISSREQRTEQVAALAVWLCTDVASQINGRTFKVGNGIVGLYSEPDMIRSMFQPEGWNLDMLDAPTTLSYLISDLRNQFLPLQATH